VERVPRRRAWISIRAEPCALFGENAMIRPVFILVDMVLCFSERQNCRVLMDVLKETPKFIVED
jgi:hypothetical protein